MQRNFDGYEISDDPTRLDVDTVTRLLSQSYWAAGRSREVVEESLRHSLCVGAYLDGGLVGFARVVTDYAVIFWLCDVIVADGHRGRGLGKAMTTLIVEDPRLCELNGLLATKDAHSLYERYGFRREGERLMYRLNPRAAAQMAAQMRARVAAEE